MKYIILALSIILCFSAKAQEKQTREMQTLFGNKRGVGGYLGFTTKFTKINNDHSLLTGGSLNLILGQSLNIGVEGYGMATSVVSNRVDTAGNPYYMYLGYGGLNIEPVIASNNVIHVTFPVLLGVGGIGYSPRLFWVEEPDGDINIDFNHDIQSGKMFLVAEPGANLELNVFKWMRIAAGASYRFTEQLDSSNPATEEIGGLSANFSLRFGWF